MSISVFCFPNFRFLICENSSSPAGEIGEAISQAEAGGIRGGL
jgi:hypothetical protein